MLARRTAPTLSGGLHLGLSAEKNGYRLDEYASSPLPRRSKFQKARVGAMLPEGLRMDSTIRV